VRCEGEREYRGGGEEIEILLINKKEENKK